MNREEDNNILVSLIIICSLTLQCVLFMLADVLFYISVTHNIVCGYSSPYKLRTIHSEQPPMVLIIITVWSQ